MKKLIFFILFLSTHVLALKPIEGIILGDVKEDKQFDPLERVFDKRFSSIDKSERNIYHRELVLEYLGFYREGENLKNSCGSLTDKIVYQSLNKQDTAIRSVMATYQFIILDLLSRAIGRYAQVLQFEKEEYINLTDNLVYNFCSKNISVYSLKLIKKNLLLKFFENNNFDLPSHTDNPYYPNSLKEKLNRLSTREKEMALSVKAFRSLCSWNGMVDDYRLMQELLKNPFVMAYIIRNLTGKRVAWDETSQALKKIKSDSAVQVLCENMICRQTSKLNFDKKFPRMVGSSSIESDLQRLYCFYFDKLSLNLNERSEVVKSWIGTTSFDDYKLESLQVVSLITGFQDLLLSEDTYSDLEKDALESVNQKWGLWAIQSTNEFSKDLLYEEQVQVQIQKKEAFDDKVSRGEFEIVLDVTQGEIDRTIKNFDKLKISYDIIISKNLLNWARKKWIAINATRDLFKREAFLEQFVGYIEDQVDLQRDQFLIPPWKKGLTFLLAEELLNQLMNYPGKKFDRISNEMEIIPVKFYYGLFSLKYFRYQFFRQYR